MYILSVMYILYNVYILYIFDILYISYILYIFTQKSVLKRINGSVIGVVIARSMGVFQYTWIVSKLSVPVPEDPVKDDPLLARYRTSRHPPPTYGWLFR